MPPAPPPVEIVSPSTPDLVPNDVAATAPPVVATETGNIVAALPEPGPMPPAPPPVEIVSPSTPDPVPTDVAAATLPAEIAEPPSLGAALPEPGPMPPAAPPVQIVSPSTPDPVPNDVAAATLRAEIAEPPSLGPAQPDPGPMPPAAPPVQIVALSTPVQKAVAAATPGGEAAETVSIVAAWPRVLPPRAAPPVQIASLGTPDPVQDDARQMASSIDAVDECLVPEICIDRYLWSLYQRTVKIDTNKVVTRVKATVKRKGKTRTVTKTFTRYVVADFTWKDPAAAEKVGMSLKDYVIGGMDRRFKLKLYRALRAMDDAGLMPGITSAFRDDYRQAIASGNKAASDSSFHGGSRRGGYGYGLAADLVSVKGATRMERFVSSRELWSWIDAREKELGIGRPYLDRDPPHVGPIDGKEYAAKRGRPKAKLRGIGEGETRRPGNKHAPAGRCERQPGHDETRGKVKIGESGSSGIAAYRVHCER